MALAPATLELTGQWEKCTLNKYTHTHTRAYLRIAAIGVRKDVMRRQNGVLTRSGTGV